MKVCNNMENQKGQRLSNHKGWCGESPHITEQVILLTRIQIEELAVYLNSMRGSNGCEGETTFQRCKMPVLKHNPQIIGAKIQLQFGRPIAHDKNIGRTHFLNWSLEISSCATDLQVQSHNTIRTCKERKGTISSKFGTKKYTEFSHVQ